MEARIEGKRGKTGESLRLISEVTEKTTVMATAKEQSGVENIRYMEMINMMRKITG
jgi:hypothetical protein